MNERRIVQISVASAPLDKGEDIIYALANDGTLWSLYTAPGSNWTKLPDLPQVGRELARD